MRLEYEGLEGIYSLFHSLFIRSRSLVLHSLFFPSIQEPCLPFTSRSLQEPCHSLINNFRSLVFDSLVICSRSLVFDSLFMHSRSLVFHSLAFRYRSSVFHSLVFCSRSSWPSSRYHLFHFCLFAFYLLHVLIAMPMDYEYNRQTAWCAMLQREILDTFLKHTNQMIFVHASQFVGNSNH